MHWLEASWEAARQAASEISMLLTVAGSINAKRIRRGSGGGGYNERLGKGGG